MSDEMNFSDEAVRQMQELLNAPAFDRIRRADQAAALRNDVHADWISNFMNRMMKNEVPDHMIDDKTGQAHSVNSLVDELRERVQLDNIEKQAEVPEAQYPNMEALPKEEPHQGPVSIFWTQRGPVIAIQVYDQGTKVKLEDHKEKNPIESLKILEEMEAKYPQGTVIKTPWFQGPLGILIKKIKFMVTGAASFPMTAQGIQKKKSKSLSDDDKHSVSQFIEDLYSSHRGYCDTPAVLYALKEKFGNDLVIDNMSLVEDKIEDTKDKYKSPGVSSILPSPYQGQPMKTDPQTDMFQPLFEHIKGI